MTGSEIPQSGSTPRVICPGSEGTFGNSYRANTPGSPIYLNWTPYPNGSNKVAIGIDFVQAGYCPNGICHYPPQCSGGPYWTYTSFSDGLGNPGGIYPNIGSAWLHLRMRNAGQWLPSQNAGAAVSVGFVLLWNDSTGVACVPPAAGCAPHHVNMAFQPGGRELYGDSYPDPKVLQILTSVDGQQINMSSSGWGYPALTQDFQTYDINLTELYDYARTAYNLFQSAPPAATLRPVVSVFIEVREQSTQWVEIEKYRLGSS